MLLQSVSKIKGVIQFEALEHIKPSASRLWTLPTRLKRDGIESKQASLSCEEFKIWTSHVLGSSYEITVRLLNWGNATQIIWSMRKITKKASGK